MSYRLCSSSCTTETWNSISSGTNINQSANYIQYKADLATTDSTVTPSLDSVNIGVSYTPMTIKARSCDDALCAGETDWSALTAVATDSTAGTKTSAPISLSIAPNRYVQYQAELKTLSNTESPTLDEITINYESVNVPYDYSLSINSSPPVSVVQGTTANSIAQAVASVTGGLASSGDTPVRSE